jgi:hypothetical protein
MSQEVSQKPDAGQGASDTEPLQLDGLVGQAPTRRGTMTFFRNDRGAVTQALEAYGEWAEHEIAFCGRFLAPGDVVLDVGAYIGTHALAFAERVGPGGHVYSFEAQPASFALLVRNLTAVANVTAVHAAVSHITWREPRFCWTRSMSPNRAATAAQRSVTHPIRFIRSACRRPRSTRWICRPARWSKSTSKGWRTRSCLAPNGCCPRARR